MVGIPVEIRQQQYVEPGQIVRSHRERHTRKIYTANGKLPPIPAVPEPYSPFALT